MEEELEKLENELTARQKCFVEEYEKDFNATEAALRAGYAAGAASEDGRRKSAASQASRLLRNDKIIAYRRARARALYERMGLDQNKIALKLMEIYQRCMQEKAVLEWDREEREYVNRGSYVFDAKNAIRCLELLGNELGMFSSKINVRADLQGVEEYLRSLGEQ